MTCISHTIWYAIFWQCNNSSRDTAARVEPYSLDYFSFFGREVGSRRSSLNLSAKPQKMILLTEKPRIFSIFERFFVHQKSPFCWPWFSPRNIIFYSCKTVCVPGTTCVILGSVFSCYVVFVSKICEEQFYILLYNIYPCISSSFVLYISIKSIIFTPA